MNNTIKSRLMVTTLMAVLIFSQSCSKAETNKTDGQTIITTKNLATNQLIWLADEKSFQGDKDTNGWACELRISNRPWLSNQNPPMCGVSINNVSTNLLHCWAGLFGSTYSRIELLDSKGEPVEKTPEGKQIGTWTDAKQIQEMVKNRFQELNRGRARTDGFVPLRPGRSVGIAFSMPDLFVLKESGEYTLKVQTCLIQRVGGEEYDPQLKITWLPEVTTGIQIRSLDIPPVKLPPNAQTNSLNN